MRRTLLVPLMAAATALSGCSMVDSVVERVSPDAEVVVPTVTIGVLAPLSGGQTRTGRSVVDAVEQAVADSGGVEGWQLDVVAYDLAGASLADDLAELKAGDSTVAVVTGFGPDDVRTIVPELDESGLTVLSPADSDPRHLRGADPADPIRPWAGYVSVAAEPTPEETALADHLVRVVGVQRAVVLSDGTRASESRGDAVTRSLEQRGVTRARAVAWQGAKASRPIERAVSRLKPGDALVIDAPAALAADLAGLAPSGVSVVLTSPLDDLSEPQSAELEGALAPLPGLDPRRGAAELRAAFEASDRDATEGPFGPAAYDGARLLVDAFSRCLPDAQRSSSPSRSQCRSEVAGATWNGLTGQVMFDEFGSRPGLLPAVVTLRNGEWRQPGG